jgi:hypothetical protein
MIKDLRNALSNTLLLHVPTKPLQTPRSWTEKDVDGNDVGDERRWTEEGITGVLLTNLLNPARATNVEVQIRTTQMYSIVPTAPNYGDLLEAFLENKADFVSGKKLFNLETMQMPRINKSGDKAGLATSFSPVLIGFSIVDASPEDIKFIENLKSLENEEGVETENLVKTSA